MRALSHAQKRVFLVKRSLAEEATGHLIRTFWMQLRVAWLSSGRNAATTVMICVAGRCHPCLRFAALAGRSGLLR